MTYNVIKNPKLIVKNSLLLFMRLLIVLFLGFYTTRITLAILGDVDFGINNVVAGTVVIFSIITMPVSSVLQRFFNVEFAKKERDPRVVFTSANRLVFIIIIILVLLYETIGLYLITKVINIPPSKVFVARIVYQISAATSIFSFLYLPYMSFLYSKENMGVNAYVEIFISVFKLAFLFIIPFVKIDVLISYSIGLLLTYVLVYVYYFLYCRAKYDETKFCCKIDKGLSVNMSKFYGWSFIESVSGITINYGSNILINIFGGVLYNTAYGISKQLSTALLSFSTSLLKAFDPQITGSEALRDNEYRDKLIIFAVKFSLLIIGFACILFSFDGYYLLSLWLGKIPTYSIQFATLSVLSAVLSSMILPLRTLILASGNIRWYFIFYGVISLASILLMFVLLKGAFPMVSVMYVIVSANLMYFLLALIVVRYYTNFRLGVLIKGILLSFISLLSVAMLYYLLNNFLRVSIANFALKFIISGFVLLFMSYYMVFSASERSEIKNIISFFKSKI